MKKSVKKLTIHSETLLALGPGAVSGGVTVVSNGRVTVCLGCRTEAWTNCNSCLA